MGEGSEREPSWGDALESSARAVPRHGWLRGALVLAVGLGGLGCLIWCWPASPRRSPLATAGGESRQRNGGNGISQDSLPAFAERLPAPPATPAEFVAEAKRLATQLLDDWPQSPQAMLLSGRISYAFNDVARANQCWQDCLKRDPDFAEARCALGEGAWEHGEFEQAAAQLAAVFAANPKLDPQRVFFLADSLMNLGRAAEAAAALERSAAEKPLTPFGQFLLGHAYLETQRYAPARDQFEAALAADPRSANAHFSLATVYARLGQPDKARLHKEQYAQFRNEELRESQRLRPTMRQTDWADPRPVVREAYLNAGRLYASAGRADQAEQHWLRALSLDPDHAETRDLLEQLYWSEGRREDAVRVSRSSRWPQSKPPP